MACLCDVVISRVIVDLEYLASDSLRIKTSISFLISDDVQPSILFAEIVD